MRKLLSVAFCAIFIAVFQLPAIAGNENQPVGARSAGLANASLTLTDVWSVHHNQAGLGSIRKISAGVYYESRFLMPELGLSAGALAIPIGKGTFGLSFRSFGYQAYKENKIGLAYGRAFGDFLSIGMQLNFQSAVFSEFYGSSSTFTAEIGAIYKAGKKVTLAAHLFNPNQSRIAEFDDERIPSVIRFGARYLFSKQVFVVAEVENALYQKPVLRGGLEYRPIDILYVRAGISGNPMNSNFGFGLQMKKFQLDFAGAFHQVLGFTPKISLTFNPTAGNEK
jgi:hypothetical protein